MSFFDDILAKITPSPGMETFLSALPQLLGAYESGRKGHEGVGNLLSMLGQFGEQNAATREKKGDVSALGTLASGYNTPSTPIASAEYQKLQPLSSGMSPDMLGKEYENVQATGQAELAKQKPANYYNTQTGQIEQHDFLDFPNGKVPKELIPWGGTAAKLMGQRFGLAPGTDKEGPTKRDAAAQAIYHMPYDQLEKQNPAAAWDVVQRVAGLGPQATLATAPARATIEANKEINVADEKAIHAARLVGLKQAKTIGVIPLSPDGVSPMIGGTIADAQANGGFSSQADLVAYQGAGRAVQTAQKIIQSATDLNAKAPTMFPREPNLVTASGDVSIPTLTRIAPQLFNPLQTQVALLADQVAKSQIGGRAQQSAMQLQQYIRSPHSTLTSVVDTLVKLEDLMNDARKATLARGKYQTDQSWNRLMNTFGAGPSSGTPAPTSTPTVPLRGSF